ncbi:hypothetical protein Taro_015083, partial [Colocasia esculenta]|nr:hypothetical protein [Colocasia esculenta]
MASSPGAAIISSTISAVSPVVGAAVASAVSSDEPPPPSLRHLAIGLEGGLGRGESRRKNLEGGIERRRERREGGALVANGRRSLPRASGMSEITATQEYTFLSLIAAGPFATIQSVIIAFGTINPTGQDCSYLLFFQVTGIKSSSSAGRRKEEGESTAHSRAFLRVKVSTPRHFLSAGHIRCLRVPGDRD